jgi:hypothetical protein
MFHAEDLQTDREVVLRPFFVAAESAYLGADDIEVSHGETLLPWFQQLSFRL